MKKKVFLLVAILALACANAFGGQEIVKIKIIQTSDVHGNYLSNNITNTDSVKGGLARAYTYIKGEREKYGENMLLFDTGDLLLWSPVAYYYNYIATDEENIAATITNYMGYDTHTYGNHDIETGHAIYDKWTAEMKAPAVCANLVNTATGQPYVNPYVVFERQGVKIAVIGILTTVTAYPWLCESLWSGIRFEDVMESSRKWVAYVREHEHPDIIFGLFHVGKDGDQEFWLKPGTGYYGSNSTEQVAKEVEGFDAIFFGHDHMVCCEKLLNNAGKDVWLLNPANAVMNVAELSINIVKDDDGIKCTSMIGRIVDVSNMPIEDDFEKRFANAISQVKEFNNKEIGRLDRTLDCRDSFFGSSPYISFINEIQLDLTKADLSFFSPYSEGRQVIQAGILHNSDMNKLSPDDHCLCVMLLTGHEIKGYLEKSYSLWTSTMKSPDDHIINIKENKEEKKWIFGYWDTGCFYAAIGIDYEVDVTKPFGNKITILQMSDGQPFDEDATYKVVLECYHADRQRVLLSEGAGIKTEDIINRIIWTSDNEVRYYIMKYIEQQKVVSPQAKNNWRFVPESWAKPALERDRKLLFGD